MKLCKEFIKSRVIHFDRDSGEDVAERARELLSAVDGLASARIKAPYALSIRYDIRVLSLQMIEAALADVGFMLSTNPLCRIKRELIAYCEDNLRESLGVIETEEDAEVQEQPEHSAHDPRPYNWRNYS